MNKPDDLMEWERQDAVLWLVTAFLLGMLAGVLMACVVVMI